MSPLETRVTEICERVLGTSGISLDDDFYVLGIDSQQAVLVALEIEKTFTVDLPLEVMESSANVRALTVWLEAAVMRRGRRS